jgi:NhaP-type Na+/H+ or K+/H+ antiporter
MGYVLFISLMLLMLHLVWIMGMALLSDWLTPKNQHAPLHLKPATIGLTTFAGIQAAITFLAALSLPRHSPMALPFQSRYSLYLSGGA